MFLYDFLFIFSWLESKSLILIMSLKKEYVGFLILICLIFLIYMFNGIAFNGTAFNKLLFEYLD